MAPCEGAVISAAEDETKSQFKGSKEDDDKGRLTEGFRCYPSFRDELPKSPVKWMKGKIIDDDIGPFWRIHDKLYDFTDFVDNHPGGKDWLKASKGSDITEVFETSHLSSAPESLLSKYYVRDASTPRNSPYTFKEDGFYKTFKRKVIPILQKTGKGPSRTMLMIQDGMALLLLIFALAAAYTGSYALAVVAGVVLALTGTVGHNFFHQKDNWRMYMFDLMFISSYEWRISHSFSHHVFTNTIYDFEITILEPIWEFLPKRNKTMFQRYGSYVYEIIAMPFMFFMVMLRRIRMILKGHETFRWEFLLPYMELALMATVAPSFKTALTMWAVMHSTSGAWFTGIGIITSHHHPDIYHAGDKMNEDRDWGICQLDATRDRKEIAGNLLLVALNFGDHTLHHLLPTVDHSKLKALYPALLETCKEFGIPFEMFSQWNIIYGKYMAMANTTPRTELPIYAKKAN